MGSNPAAPTNKINLHVNLVETASVPRNAMGKIQRETVRDNVLLKLMEMRAAGTLPNA